MPTGARQGLTLVKSKRKIRSRCESNDRLYKDCVCFSAFFWKESAITLNISPLYFLPGIYGDKQELVEFQSRLSVDVPVENIELQSLEEPLADLINMEAIGAAVAHEIDRRCPEGPLRLTGYSFGGSVAFEAAQHLIGSGRSVCFLGIIDAPLRIRPRSLLHSAEEGSEYERPLRLLRKIYSLGNGRLACELLGRFCSSDSRRRRVLSMMNRFWPSHEIRVRRLLLRFFRGRAIARWHPAPFRGAVLVAISQEYSYSIDQWKCLCPQGSIVQLPGKHVQVLQSTSLEVLLVAFEKAARNGDFCEQLPI